MFQFRLDEDGFVCVPDNLSVAFPDKERNGPEGKWYPCQELTVACDLCWRGHREYVDVFPNPIYWTGQFFPVRQLDLRLGYFYDSVSGRRPQKYGPASYSPEDLAEIDRDVVRASQSWYVCSHPPIDLVQEMRRLACRAGRLTDSHFYSPFSGYGRYAPDDVDPRTYYGTQDPLGAEEDRQPEDRNDLAHVFHVPSKNLECCFRCHALIQRINPRWTGLFKRRSALSLLYEMWFRAEWPKLSKRTEGRWTGGWVRFPQGHGAEKFVIPRISTFPVDHTPHLANKNLYPKIYDWDRKEEQRQVLASLFLLDSTYFSARKDQGIFEDDDPGDGFQVSSLPTLHVLIDPKLGPTRIRSKTVAPFLLRCHCCGHVEDRSLDLSPEKVQFGESVALASLHFRYVPFCQLGTLEKLCHRRLEQVGVQLDNLEEPLEAHRLQQDRPIYLDNNEYWFVQHDDATRVQDDSLWVHYVRARPDEPLVLCRGCFYWSVGRQPRLADVAKRVNIPLSALAAWLSKHDSKVFVYVKESNK